ncbi:PC-esterase domain-containing protein 1A [Polypterus senegalus]|uniref:PC-esterase domain-containing protein 1A n=1 Tax=Polypterus senegalus TaxID=55291 RepID=UPI001962D928|nr:PC-esterase domain-containing protein 1A [Polypterus senegalus]
MKNISKEQVQLLLHNKFVVILGDSIQRSVYKDLVLLLQKDRYLTQSQLKEKGELNFECDQLVEGGKIGGLNNGTAYREVRQFCTAHHLVRFYFLTRIYSTYMESILADFKAGPPPDVVIMNSCVWDVSRYGINSMKEYRMNLEKFFMRLKEILLPECLIIWNLTMPLGKKVYGGFLVPEIQHMEKTLRSDIIEANFYSATLADSHKFDVLDLHYHFRFELQNRMKDGVHWNQLAHRKLTFLLLGHIAEAWNVDLPDNKLENPCKNSSDVMVTLTPLSDIRIVSHPTSAKSSPTDFSCRINVQVGSSQQASTDSVLKKSHKKGKKQRKQKENLWHSYTRQRRQFKNLGQCSNGNMGFEHPYFDHGHFPVQAPEMHHAPRNGPSWMDICHPPNRYFNNHAMGMMQGMHTFQNIGTFWNENMAYNDSHLYNREVDHYFSGNGFAQNDGPYFGEFVQPPRHRFVMRSRPTRMPVSPYSVPRGAPFYRY